jgi:hypothetical protein
LRAARRPKTFREADGTDTPPAEPLKAYVFKYELPEVNAKLELRFEKPSAQKDEVVFALRVVLEALEGN